MFNFSLNLTHNIKGRNMNRWLQVGLLALALIVGSLLVYKLINPAGAHDGPHDFNIIIAAGSTDNTISATTDYAGSEAQTWEYAVLPADSPCSYHQSPPGSYTHYYFAHAKNGYTGPRQAYLTEYSYTPGEDLPIPPANEQGSKYCFGVVLEHAGDNFLYEAISLPLGKLTTTVDSTARTISATTGDSAVGLFIYDIIPAASQCGIETDLSTAKPYADGQALAYTAAQAGQKACFRAVVPGAGSVPGYWYGSAIIPATASHAVDVSQGSADLTFKAVDNQDDTNDPTTWLYVKIDDGESCDSNQFSSSTTSYIEDGDVLYTNSDIGQRICFRSALTDANNTTSYAYGLSPAIEAVRVASILAFYNVRPDTNILTRASSITIRVTFSSSVVLDGDLELVLNTGRRVRLGAVHLNRRSFDFIYKPSVGEYTPGQATPGDLTDDAFLEVTELSLAAEASLTGAGNGLGGPVNLALDGLELRRAFRPATTNSLNSVALPDTIPHKLFSVDVDARIPTLTVTNPDVVAPDPVATYTGTIAGGITVTAITVTDDFDDSDPDLSYQQVGFNSVCDESTPVPFTDYTPGILSVSANTQLCMRTEDAAGNVGYKLVGGTLETVVNKHSRIFSAVDDFADNDNPASLAGLDSTGFHEGLGTYLFEYYLIPVSWVTEADLVGQPGSRSLDYNCRQNIFNGRQIPLAERYPYQEGSQLDLSLKDYNDYYVCFRSRRHDPNVYWAHDQTDFGALVSDKITGVVRQSIVSIEDDQTGHSDVTLDYGDEFKIRVGLQVPAYFTSDQQVSDLSLTLSNGQTATYHSNGGNYLDFSYTVGSGRDNTTEPLTVISFNDANNLVLVDPSLPVGNNLADNDTYQVVRSKPYIHEVYALPIDDNSVRTLGMTAEVVIKVGVSEPLTIDLNGHAPAEAIWIETNAFSRANYVSYDSARQEMTFKYIVSSNDFTNRLTVLSIINFESGVTVTATTSGADLRKTIPSDDSRTLKSSIWVNGWPNSITFYLGRPRHTYVVTDYHETPTTLGYVFIATTAACDETAFTGDINPYTERELVSETQLVSFADTDRTDDQLCFRSVTDNDFGEDEIVYATKNNLDATAPVITVGPIINYQVRATVDDADADFEYKIIAQGAACTGILTTDFTSYTPNTPVDLKNDSRACFRANDNANGGEPSNITHATSALLSDHTAPEIVLTDLGIERGGNKVGVSTTDTPPGQPSTIEEDDNPHDHRPDVVYRSHLLEDSNCSETTENIWAGLPRPKNVIVYEGHILCFRATDDMGNTSYKTSSPGTDVAPPIIEIKQGSAKNTFVANDDDDDLTSWLYRFIHRDSSTHPIIACDENAFFVQAAPNNPVQVAGVVNYTEGDDVPYDKSKTDQAVCFRSFESSDQISYKLSPVIKLDSTAPRFTGIEFAGNDNLLLLGESLRISLAVSEAVSLDTSQGSPSLSLNTGAQAILNQTLTGRRSLVFNYTVRRGEEAKLLLITGFNLNGAVIEDLAGNSLETSLAGVRLDSTIVVGGLHIVVDGQPPQITLRAGSQPNSYQVFDSDSDNGEPQFDQINRYAWLPADSDCDSTVDFSQSYNAQQEIRYSHEHNRQRLCVRSVDQFGRGNIVYSQTGLVNLPSPPIPVDRLSLGIMAEGPNQFAATLANQPLNTSAQVRVGYGLVECEVRIVGNPYESYDEASLPVIEIEAQQRICFQARDSVTGDVIYDFRDGRDITPPDITVGAVVENIVYAVVVDDVDHNPRFEYQLVASSILCTSNLTTGFLTQAPKQQSMTLEAGQKACFRAEDSAGNVSYAASTPGIADTIPPTMVVVYDPEDDTYQAFYTDDGLDEPEASYAFANLPADCGTNVTNWRPYNYERLTLPNLNLPTNQTVCFRAQDAAGNVSYADPSTPPDTIAPVVTLSALAADGTITAQASDNSRVLLSFDFKLIHALTPCSETIGVRPYHGQTITIPRGQKACFRARDIARNSTVVESAPRW